MYYKDILFFFLTRSAHLCRTFIVFTIMDMDGFQTSVNKKRIQPHNEMVSMFLTRRYFRSLLPARLVCVRD